MREIINIHIGQSGNQIGEAFWRQILKEHDLDHQGKSLSNKATENRYQEVFFDKVSESKYVPRAILIDLEPGVINRIQQGELGKLFDSKNIIKRVPGAANNWARGHNSEGNTVIDEIMEVVENNVKKTNSLQGFTVTHSLGGGTGSGLGSLVVEKLKEKYPKHPIFTFSVFPSPLISDSVVEPYNSILTLNKLKTYANEVIVLDNHALFNIASTKLQRRANYEDLNYIIALIMSSVTASLRFHGTLNTDLSEFLVNLVPFPTNHFLMASFAPMIAETDSSYTKLDLGTIASEAFKEDNFTAAADLDSGVHLAACALFRGKVTTMEVDQNMTEIRKNLKYASYVPTGMKIGITDVSPQQFDTSGLALINHTSVSQIFDRILDQFNVMYNNNAFIHWYESEGLSKDEMGKARDSVTELSESYKNAATDD